jgi:outer membrane protein
MAFYKAMLRGSAVGAVLFAWSGSASGQTLRDALAAAYSNNSELMSQRETLRSTIEGVPQALGGWRPSIDLSADYGKNRVHLNGRSPRRTERDPRSVGASITQSLFNGFRTTSSVKAAELDVKAAQATLLDTEQDILLSAVVAYMDVVRDQAVLDLNANNEQVLSRQLDATRERFNVGEITRTDVSQAEARLSGARAARIAAEATLQNSRAAYLSIVGEAPGQLLAPEAPADLPPTLEATLASARANHPDVVAAQYTEQSAQEEIKNVQGELLPSLDLVGSITRLYENSGDDSQQTTQSITLELNQPIYEQGVTYSRLRAAKILAGKSRIDLDTVRRDIVETAARSWESLKSARAQIVSFQAQIRASEIALEGVQREAAVGSRTVLDILDAEQELLIARVNLVRSQRDEIVTAYQLKEAIGEFTAARLQLPVRLYDPNEYYNRVRDKWWGWNVPGGTAGDSE